MRLASAKEKKHGSIYHCFSKNKSYIVVTTKNQPLDSEADVCEVNVTCLNGIFIIVCSLKTRSMHLKTTVIYKVVIFIFIMKYEYEFR